MKRLLVLLAILLISQVGYGQQKMDQLFNAFRGESDVTSVNIGNITRDSRTKVLVKIKEDMIRELVIFTTGSDNALIRIKGKISPSDLDRVINEHKTGNY